MKKLTALLLVLAMLVTLAACTKKDEKKEPKKTRLPRSRQKRLRSWSTPPF